MRKKKIYLDTSVISHLDAEDTIDKMQTTLGLWEFLKDGYYDIYVSDLVFDEINKCNNQKRNFLLKKLDEINYTKLEINDEIVELVWEYLNDQVLTLKSIDDLTHIAFAVSNDIDYILSWNFKHFVNIKTINKVNLLNKELGFDEILIIPPVMLIGGEEDERK